MNLLESKIYEILTALPRGEAIEREVLAKMAGADDRVVRRSIQKTAAVRHMDNQRKRRKGLQDNRQSE